MYMYNQRPKVFPQNYFSMDSNAFSCLQEALYCIVSESANNCFVMVVKLNERYTHYTI